MSWRYVMTSLYIPSLKKKIWALLPVVLCSDVIPWHLITSSVLMLHMGNRFSIHVKNLLRNRHNYCCIHPNKYVALINRGRLLSTLVERFYINISNLSNTIFLINVNLFLDRYLWPHRKWPIYSIFRSVSVVVQEVVTYLFCRKWWPIYSAGGDDLFILFIDRHLWSYREWQIIVDARFVPFDWHLSRKNNDWRRRHLASEAR